MPRNVRDHADELTRRLQSGDSLVLFPEGTTSDGNRTLPFKSALFTAAQIEIGGQALTVQPISIAYSRLDGMPMGRHFRPFYAWYGDVDMIPHIWGVLGLGNLTAEVEFHPAVTVTELGSRKALAEHCSAAVARGVREVRAAMAKPRMIAHDGAVGRLEGALLEGVGSERRRVAVFTGFAHPR